MLELFFAERKGFEPPVPVKAQLLSREPQSTALAPLQKLLQINFLRTKIGVQMYTKEFL